MKTSAQSAGNTTTTRRRLGAPNGGDNRRARFGAKIAVVSLIAGLAMTFVGGGAVQAAAPVGEGFTVSAADLSYILEQIKIAESHVVNTTSATGPCGALLGTGPHQIANPALSFGLRTVDGSCNNLQPGQETWGAADQTFPRLTTPAYRNAEPITAALPVGPPGPTSYAQTSGSVVDSEPRVISNLIADQTSTNPAAVAAAGFPVRTQGDAGVVPCTVDPSTADPNGTPDNCVPSNKTLFIPNVTTDFGLSSPYNSLFTIFGQFFDHGIDKITNGGSGTVFVPLKADDPLRVNGPDGDPSTPDQVPASQAFMVLTRGTTITDANGQRNSPNTDTPYVDLSQTYSSHASHQIFLREYDSTTGVPLSTGRILSSADGGLATWAMIKKQAATKLGLQLVDLDVNNIPMIASDPYGNFTPGPHGLPQYVTATGLVEGNLAAPVRAPVDVLHIETAFLNDIAHSATPTDTPDPDNVAGGGMDPVAKGQYDNELLDLHFICGDGRCNENIALSAIHQVFQSEHDRLVDDIQNTLNQNPKLLAAYNATSATTFKYGERLFQAARFVTEMEYQHLVFEEFARKVQPAINPFQPFALIQTDINAAISAEFAHAVYRFGHSMLDEDIPRTNEDGSDNSIPLLKGFLNPAGYFDGGSAGRLNSRQAAGSVVMGLSDQVGNEIDEFVSNTLRNNLLGLPLDLAAINMARARSEGIPSLNNVRKQLFAATNDGQLTPYTNWIDFGLALKHPESLTNFVAAYGQHPTILAQSTLAGKREAARLIVDPRTGEVPPADALDFMGSTGAWANAAGGVSITGLDDVDLWIGGLAENTNPFGGLLGTTFNYVFENQLTNLQNGDRFYYLARTPGMNLRSQLEGNSFAELVMRNTTAHSLKADAFATADCKFQLGNTPGIAGPINGTSIVDDPTTECNENALLIRMPGGQIRYRSNNSIDRPGVNGQNVFNGTAAADKVYGGNDNDTFLGNEGADIIDGGAGDDVALGGTGNDIITDAGGFDVLKGGPDNDALDGGIGDDVVMGGDGADFTNGGANTNSTFSGAGNDFALGGQGVDEIIGGAGDDWQEGGDMPDLLIGDSSTFFFDDHDLPGNDVFIGQGGDDDYDYEGGDDIGVAGPGIEKNAGASGFDWLIGQGDPQPLFQDLDLNINLDGGQPAIEARDRFNEVEALSGWNLDDELHGDNVVPTAVGGGGFIGCDALDQDGLDRIAGLDALVPPLLTDPAPIEAATTTRYCGLDGNVWGDGNILLGGGGSDMIEGRGADDIIDGDKYLGVRLSVRTDVTNPATELGTTDLMTKVATSGSFGPGTTGMTLQQAVFAGLVDPGNIAIVREILTPPVAVRAGTVDTAMFRGPMFGYSIVDNPDGSITISDAAGANLDGTDTLWNIERAQFCNTFDVTRSRCLASETISLDSPTATLSAASLSFAPHAIVPGPQPQAVTVSNTGAGQLDVTSSTITGADAGSFAKTTDCTTTLVPNATCSFTVTFDAAATGNRAAQLNIFTNAGNVVVDLAGVGLTKPAITATSTVASGPVRDSNGLWTIGYDLTVANSATAGPGLYTLDDALQFGSGVSIQSVQAAAVTPGLAVNSSFNGVADGFVASAAIDPGATHMYRVTVTATVAPSAPGTGDCDTTTSGPGTGFMNSALVSVDGANLAPVLACHPYSTLTLVKNLVNESRGNATLDQFVLSARAGQDAPIVNGPDPDPALDSGIGAVVPAGDYALAETTLPGYAASNWGCTGGVVNGNIVTVLDGTDVVCVVTNDDSPVDLQLVESDGEASASAGGSPFDYTLTIDNVGTRDADLGEPVSVTDILPAGLVFASVPSNCAIDGQKLTCLLDAADLQVSDPAIVVTVTVSAAPDTASGSYTNMAYVTTIDDPACDGAGCVPPCTVDQTTKIGNNTDCEDTPVTLDATTSVTNTDSVGGSPEFAEASQDFSSDTLDFSDSLALPHTGSETTRVLNLAVALLCAGVALRQIVRRRRASRPRVS